MLAPVTVTALTRYSARSEEKPPLPTGILELAENPFTVGMFRRRRSHWNELVQKYLMLPPDQHNCLVKDLQPAQMFHKVESEACFKYIFKFGKDLGDCLKNMRVSQRIVFCMVDTVYSHIPVLRGLGMFAGLSYTTVAPAGSTLQCPRCSRTAWLKPLSLVVGCWTLNVACEASWRGFVDKTEARLKAEGCKLKAAS